MINDRMKTYNCMVKDSGVDNYGQPLKTYTMLKTVDVSISLITKIINELDIRYLKATHLGLTYDKDISEDVRLVGEDKTYLVKIANKDGRMAQLTLEVVI